ncbi:transposase [Escherichia coli M114]|nr:transposase [Escherichia coli M114]
MFLALGINIAGQKELLGMRLAENEGANFWFNVLTELKNRGLNDILIACVDGLKAISLPQKRQASRHWKRLLRPGTAAIRR